MHLTLRHCGGTEAAMPALLARETLRCRALLERDYAGLADLLDDALVHIHSTGEVHGKTDYLTHAAGPGRLLEIKRGELGVRVFGDAALMTGTLSTTIQPPAPIAAVTVHAHVMQIWLLSDDVWRMLAFQATRLPPASLRQSQ